MSLGHARGNAFEVNAYPLGNVAPPAAKTRDGGNGPRHGGRQQPRTYLRRNSEDEERRSGRCEAR
eukprot:15380819-Alexandrium_andersonii.AAC.1